MVLHRPTIQSCKPIFVKGSVKMLMQTMYLPLGGSSQKGIEQKCTTQKKQNYCCHAVAMATAMLLALF